MISEWELRPNSHWTQPIHSLCRSSNVYKKWKHLLIINKMECFLNTHLPASPHHRAPLQTLSRTQHSSSLHSFLSNWSVQFFLLVRLAWKWCWDSVALFFLISAETDTSRACSSCLRKEIYQWIFLIFFFCRSFFRSISWMSWTALVDIISRDNNSKFNFIAIDHFSFANFQCCIGWIKYCFRSPNANDD